MFLRRRYELNACRSDGPASSVGELRVSDWLSEIGPFNMIGIDVLPVLSYDDHTKHESYSRTSISKKYYII